MSIHPVEEVSVSVKNNDEGTLQILIDWRERRS